MRPTEKLTTTEMPAETTAYLQRTDFRIFFQLELVQVSADNVRATEMTLVQAVADAFETELFYVPVDNCDHVCYLMRLGSLAYRILSAVGGN